MRTMRRAVVLAGVVAAAYLGMGAWFFGGGAVAPAYLVNQNFEGTGYDNGETWTESGTFNEDYTTIVLRGSQSGTQTTATSYTEFDLVSEYTELWGHTLFRIPDVTPAAEEFVLEFMNADRDEQFRIVLRTTGVWRVTHGGVVSSSSANGGDLADATTVRVWWYFKTETSDGAGDGIGQVWTSTTEETARADGTQLVNQANGGMLDGIRYVRLIYGPADNYGIYDQVIVHNAAVTSVDS